MSRDEPSAQLFYGYRQPDDDRAAFRKLDYAVGPDATPWSATYTQRKHGCIGVAHGYDGQLGFFLAVEASLYSVVWANVVTLTPHDFEIHPQWNAQLQQAAQAFHLDVSGMVPAWYLVCLYL